MWAALIRRMLHLMPLWWILRTILLWSVEVFHWWKNVFEVLCLISRPSVRIESDVWKKERLELFVKWMNDLSSLSWAFVQTDTTDRGDTLLPKCWPDGLRNKEKQEGRGWQILLRQACPVARRLCYFFDDSRPDIVRSDVTGSNAYTKSCQTALTFSREIRKV